ncbi:MAG: methyltransferase domain-containing protein [Candidatus Lokiarchaeota archaeon]|nr:methyltransferase domain-containing protein [Candidatus Lokiarchaeota archaeon]
MENLRNSRFNDECDICQEIIGNNDNCFRRLISFNKLSSRKIKETNNFICLVSLGALQVGHVLVLPKKHITSMSRLTKKSFNEFENLVSTVRQIIESKLLTKTIVFEHGTSEENMKGGASVEHAHLHICPSKVNIENLIKLSNFTKHHINNIQELTKLKSTKNGYLYYESIDGKKYAYELFQDIPTQFMRRIYAESLSKSENWNWIEYPMINNVIQTVEKLIDNLSSYKSTIDAYNYIAKEYFVKTKNFDPSSEVRDDINYFLSKLKGQFILDAGAGACRDSKYMLEQGFEVEAIDLSEKLLNASSHFCPNSIKRVMDILNLGYIDNIFDGIWCSAVLLHLDRNKLQLALSEFYRVLKKGGILHFSVKEGIGHKRLFINDKKQYYRDFYFYNSDLLSKFVEENNFKILKLKMKKEKDSCGEPANWIKYLTMKI